MPKALPQDTIEQYRRDGYYFPLPVLPGAEAAALRAGIEAFEATQGGGAALGPDRERVHPRRGRAERRRDAGGGADALLRPAWALPERLFFPSPCGDQEDVTSLPVASIPPLGDYSVCWVALDAPPEDVYRAEGGASQTKIMTFHGRKKS